MVIKIKKKQEDPAIMLCYITLLCYISLHYGCTFSSFAFICSPLTAQFKSMCRLADHCHWEFLHPFPVLPLCCLVPEQPNTYVENSQHFPYALEVSPGENMRSMCTFMTSKADAEQDSIPKVHRYLHLGRRCLGVLEDRRHRGLFISKELNRMLKDMKFEQHFV